MTSTFDGEGELPLMSCACSGYALRNDFSLFTDEALQLLFILVVDERLLVITEAASPLPPYLLGCQTHLLTLEWIVLLFCITL